LDRLADNFVIESVKSKGIVEMKHKDASRRVLITGCSSGFGLLTAVKAAKAGYDVIATMRNLGKADRLRQALNRVSATATIDQLDVTRPDMIETIVNKYAPIDILVNNAGILIGGGLLDIKTGEMQSIFETNYFGPVNLTKAVVPHMIDTGAGLIINIASLAGRFGHMFNATYSASKHALVGVSRSIRIELKPFNIKVVSVEPGYHKTEIIRANANLSENFHNEESPMFDLNRGFARLMLRRVFPRAAEPEQVARKIVQIMGMKNPKAHYIIGKDARFITTLQWLGLGRLFENVAYKELLRQTKKAKKKHKEN
jgi:NAD(P)-dependent dehydrogenase (short-subunit alcohol dehydrogenase family)